MSAVSLRGRLAKAEGGLGDALLWSEAQKLAAEFGEPPEQIFQEARQLINRYWHLAKPRPGGRVDIDPVLRAIAEGEGLDYDELVLEVRRNLRHQRVREARRPVKRQSRWTNSPFMIRGRTAGEMTFLPVPPYDCLQPRQSLPEIVCVHDGSQFYVRVQPEAETLDCFGDAG